MKPIQRLNPFLFVGILLSSTNVRAVEQPPPPQFDMTGVIQEATLDTNNSICTVSDPRLRGGTIVINGHTLIVPCNTLLQLPAATMTFADLFDPVTSEPVGSYIGGAIDPIVSNPTLSDPAPKIGLALTDAPAPAPSFEVRAQGNIVSGKYIVGLISPISQQILNASSGLVSYIDYGIGAFRVGGIPNDTKCKDYGITSSSCSGALVQINDPIGRWGKPHSPDPRFSGDYENSTISAATGFPMCIPRFDPAVQEDPECPIRNRPLNGDSRFFADTFKAQGEPLSKFTMPAPVDGQYPDARLQAPIMVGDQLNYAGTVVKIDPLGPNSAANTYISAHTVNVNVGIFTSPGVPPAYVTVEDLLIGTDGAQVQGITQEASTRMTVVGFTTDPTQFVEIYAQDVNPCTGQEKLRLLATVDPSVDAIKGRFTFRVLGGTFMPPTRNYVVKSQTQKYDPVTFQRVEYITANGLVSGQFMLPNFEFIFPENHVIGDPIIPFNFQDLPFLALGSGPADGFGTVSPVLGQLDPWPGAVAPPKATCTALGLAPLVNAGQDFTSIVNTQATLTATVTWDTNSDPKQRIISWAAPAGVTLSNANTLSPTFIVPNVKGPLTFTLNVSDNIGSGSDTVSVSINKPNAGDIVAVTAATWVLKTGKKGSFGNLSVTATTNDQAAILSLQEFGTDGSINNYGTGTLTTIVNGTATYTWNVKGAPLPASLLITSTKGGSAKATCGGTTTQGRMTCQ